MSKMIWKLSRRSALALALLPLVGCIKHHPRKSTPATLPAIPATMPAPPTTAPVGPTTTPVATEDLGTVGAIPGLAKKPKPFIALPKVVRSAAARPSTLLLEHASPDSPVPLSEYGRQPTFSTADFHLRSDLTAADVERRLGPPAQIADNDDPWLVYRLKGNREIWLHFAGSDPDHLLAADVIRGVEDGYAREQVFQAR
jgi:hypothetical protein